MKMRTMLATVITSALLVGVGCDDGEDHFDEIDDRDQVDVAPHEETPAARQRNEDPARTPMDSDTLDWDGPPADDDRNR